MVHALLSKYWKPHPTKQLLYGHLTSILQTLQVRQDMLGTAGEVRIKLPVMYSNALLPMDTPALADQQNIIFIGWVILRWLVKTDSQKMIYLLVTLAPNSIVGPQFTIGPIFLWSTRELRHGLTVEDRCVAILIVMWPLWFRIYSIIKYLVYTWNKIIII